MRSAGPKILSTKSSPRCKEAAASGSTAAGQTAARQTATGRERAPPCQPEHAHPQGAHPRGHSTPDVPVADDTHRLSRDFDDVEGVPAPLALAPYQPTEVLGEVQDGPHHPLPQGATEDAPPVGYQGAALQEFGRHQMVDARAHDVDPAQLGRLEEDLAQQVLARGPAQSHGRPRGGGQKVVGRLPHHDLQVRGRRLKPGEQRLARSTEYEKRLPVHAANIPPSDRFSVSRASSVSAQP